MGEFPSNAARPGPLPSGRHHLDRGQVVASQRARMIAALVETAREKGYARTSVAEIVRRAGVSRETFYQQFLSREDCFVQALETVTERLAGLLERAWRPVACSCGTDAPGAAGTGEARPAAPQDTFRLLLRLYLRTLGEHPAYARLFLVEVYAAGPVALARRMEWQRRFADAVFEIFPGGEAAADERHFACEAVVAAVAQLVTARVVADDPEGLRELEDPLVGLAVRLLG